MISFKTFLESWPANKQTRTIGMPLETALNEINVHCAQAKNSQHIQLWRGSSRSNFEAAKIIPKQFFRKSVSGSLVREYHNYLMSWLPSWSNYPKRINCVIFTQKPEVANQYAVMNDYQKLKYSPEDPGAIYKVYPYDNAKIAICSTEDIWGDKAFPHITIANFFSILDFDGQFNILLNWADSNILKTVQNWPENIVITSNQDYYKLKAFDSDLNEMVDAIQQTDSFIKYHFNDIKKALTLIPATLTPTRSVVRAFVPFLRRIIEHYEHSGNLKSYLDTLLNPESNKFKLTTITNLARDNAWVKNEMWTDSPCILIHKEKAQQMKID